MDTTATSDPLGSPPPGRPRLVVSVFIALWLVAQVLLPFSYYLRSDFWDERFAWRMFSDVSVLSGRCSVTVTEMVEGSGATGSARTARVVPLDRTIHPAWTAHLRVGRQLVVERLLESRCRRDPLVGEVRYRRACPTDLAERAPDLEARLDCRTGAIDGVSPSAP